MPTRDRKLRSRRRSVETFADERAARLAGRTATDAEWPTVHRRLTVWLIRRHAPLGLEHAEKIAFLYRTGRFLPALPPSGADDAH